MISSIMGTLFLKISLIAISSTVAFSESSDTNTTLLSGLEDYDLADASFSTVLSRRKRYLLFPDGSSFQLVFCTQTHGYLQVGDIVWFGTTAALAWELPSDPDTFSIFKEQSKLFEGNRREDKISKHIYYLNEKGKVISKVPYRKRPIVNPAFAKRSVNNDGTKDDCKTTKAISVKKLHALQKNKDYFKMWNSNNIEFHRDGRKSFYEKLEAFFKAQGWNGRECVLRMLCEIGNDRKEQGTFLEEIMRATFTLPKGREFESELHKQYDVAHGSRGDCSLLYPKCEDLHGQQLYDMQ